MDGPCAFLYPASGNRDAAKGSLAIGYAPGRTVAVNGAGMKILIVDDNATIRRLIRSIVAIETDEVQETSNRKTSLETFTSFRPDFVLMELQADCADGFGLAASIRSIDPKARIVIVSTYDDPVFREAAREAGACAYIVKEDLLALKKFLDQYR